MGRGLTKAQVIIVNARNRLTEAQNAVRFIEGELAAAQVRADVHQTVLLDLEKSLVVKPRSSGNGTGKSQSSPKLKGKCAHMGGHGEVCEETATSPIHGPAAGYTAYHPFAPPSPAPAPSAGKRSSRARAATLPAATLPAASSVDETVNVSTVSPPASNEGSEVQV